MTHDRGPALTPDLWAWAGVRGGGGLYPAGAGQRGATAGARAGLRARGGRRIPLLYRPGARAGSRCTRGLEHWL